MAEEPTPAFDAVPSRAGRAWVVDPIDGTRGFAKKTGQFSVMIGLLSTASRWSAWSRSRQRTGSRSRRSGSGCWVETAGGEPSAVPRVGPGRPGGVGAGAELVEDGHVAEAGARRSARRG